jgi:genome maintenance exonuclease 1
MIFNKVKLPYDDLLSFSGANGRTYETPEGNRYPSVTTVLGHLGEQSLKEWRERVGEEEANKISRQAAIRGRQVHECLEFWILGDGSLPTFPSPLVEGGFYKIAKVLEKRLSEIYGIEVPLYSDHLKIAGRTDLVGKFDGKRSILDYKNTSKAKPHEWCHSYFIQETAYSIMWEERTGKPIQQLVTIIANDEEPEAQVFIENRDNWAPQLLEAIEEHRRRNA